MFPTAARPYFDQLDGFVPEKSGHLTVSHGRNVCRCSSRPPALRPTRADLHVRCLVKNAPKSAVRLWVWCTRWFPSFFCQKKVENPSCITCIQGYCSKKRCKSKALSAKMQCSPAPTFRQICILHGVVSKDSRSLKQSMR